MHDLAFQTLILVRHAKSDWGPVNGVNLPDIERPLNDRGRKDVARVGNWLVNHLRGSMTLLVSPARRAQETAGAIAAQFEQATIITEPLLYLASCETLQAVAEQNTANCTMIVAHNPGMEEFVTKIAPQVAIASPYRKLMPTTGVYAFEYPKYGLSRGKIRFLFHQRPKLLSGTET